MTTRKALSAVVALSAALTINAVPASAATTIVATDVTALKAAEAKLISVLDAYNNTPAWTAQYNAAEAIVKTDQAALTLALAQAIPPKPVAWHLVEQQTATGTYANGVSIPTLSTTGYYTGRFKATVSLSAPVVPQVVGVPDANISWGVTCTAIYGLGNGSKQGELGVVGTSGFVVLVIPAHMRDCYAETSFSFNPEDDTTGSATRTLTATLSLFTTGQLVSKP